MLGSISQLLDFDEQADVTDTNKIQPMNLFRLLVALEQTSVDAMRDDYSILELVKDDTSTKNIDYHTNNNASGKYDCSCSTGTRKYDCTCNNQNCSIFAMQMMIRYLQCRCSIVLMFVLLLVSDFHFNDQFIYPKHKSRLNEDT